MIPLIQKRQYVYKNALQKSEVRFLCAGPSLMEQGQGEE